MQFYRHFSKRQITPVVHHAVHLWSPLMFYLHIVSDKRIYGNILCVHTHLYKIFRRSDGLWGKHSTQYYINTDTHPSVSFCCPFPLLNLPAPSSALSGCFISGGQSRHAQHNQNCYSAPGMPNVWVEPELLPAPPPSPHHHRVNHCHLRHCVQHSHYHQHHHHQLEPFLSHVAENVLTYYALQRQHVFYCSDPKCWQGRGVLSPVVWIYREKLRSWSLMH